MVSRDDLIADWRKRLAAAEESQADASKRAQWLARMRVRIYQFLLSLYGEGKWNAPEVVDSHSSAAVAVYDSPVAEALDGKPAKSNEKIRAALHSLAEAQERPVQAGPLADGLDPFDWVTVASSSGHVVTSRALKILQKAGFKARLARRGNDRFVDVYAVDYDAALTLLSSRRDEIRGRDRIGQFEGIHFLVGLTLVAIFSPFFLLALFVGWSVAPDLVAPRESRVLAALFVLGWLGCVFVYCCVAALRAIWFASPHWKQRILRHVFGVHTTPKR